MEINVLASFEANCENFMQASEKKHNLVPYKSESHRMLP